MARKNLFGLSKDTPSDVASTNLSDDDRPLAHKRRSATSSPSVGLLSKSLQLAAKDETTEALRAQLLAGQTIIELDPKLVDPSFISDRLPDSQEWAEFVESIRKSGQQSPILVRPNPAKPGRFQIAFGHRRWQAAEEISIPVKAIVRDLTDEQLILAQGQENSDRTDLSFIERARFASALLERGFDRELIMRALGVPRQTLSQFLSIIGKLPADIVEGIGRAPLQGRRPWQLLADLLQNDETKTLAREALGRAQDMHPPLSSEQRFELVRKAITMRRSRNTEFHWTSKAGETIADISEGKKHYTIKIRKDVADGFGDYLAKHFETIWRDFKAQK